MPIRVKVCGITRYEDAIAAVGLGVDALGFIFYRQSPRYVEPLTAREIIRRLPPFVSRVGVFVNEDPRRVEEIVTLTGIDTLQLHGEETPEYCRRFSMCIIKAFRISPDRSPPDFRAYPVNGYLLDTWDPNLQGGTGTRFDWSIAREACRVYGNIILAGGLGPSNLREALEVVRPYGVDLNSGVELKPGIKNARKIGDALRIIRTFA